MPSYTFFNLFKFCVTLLEGWLYFRAYRLGNFACASENGDYMKLSFTPMGDLGSTLVKVAVLQFERSLVRSQLVSVDFFIDIKSFRSHYGPGVDSASNRNEYQEYFRRGLKAAGAYGWQPYHHPVPLSRNLGTLTSWNTLGPVQACNGTALPLPSTPFLNECTEYVWELLQVSLDKKNQLDITFCILYFSSNNCSTCFGQPCAHRQELTTAWCYSLVLVCAVAAGRWSSPVGR